MQQGTLIKIKPFLIFNGYQFEPSWKTGVKGVDKILSEKLYNPDLNHIKEDVKYYLGSKNSFEISFDGKFYNIVCQEIPEKKMIKFINEIDPYDSGPDTWMEGDIEFLSKNEITSVQFNALCKKYSFENTEESDSNLFELGMIVASVTLSSPKIQAAIEAVLDKSSF
jgi:hypothetical protein